MFWGGFVCWGGSSLAGFMFVLWGFVIKFFSAPTNFLIIGSLAFNFGMIVELVLLPASFAL